jgi:hypothetical protein
VAKVTSMYLMVSSCLLMMLYANSSPNPICVKFFGSVFNTGNLNGWNVAKVTNMDYMVSSCDVKAAII